MRRACNSASRILSLSASLAVAATVGGCGGGGSEGSAAVTASPTATTPVSPVTPPSTVSGSVIKGALSGALVKIYRVNADGTRGPLLTQAQTNADGSYTASFSGYTGVVVVEATVVPGVTKMYDEATGSTLDPSPDFTLRTVVGAQSGVKTSAEVNPFTEDATQKASALGGFSETNVTTVAKQQRDALGFDPFIDHPAFDPVTHAPQNSAALAVKSISELAKDGALGCSGADQSSRVSCVVNAVRTKGVNSTEITTVLQQKITVEADKVGLAAPTRKYPNFCVRSAEQLSTQLFACG